MKTSDLFPDPNDILTCPLCGSSWWTPINRDGSPGGIAIYKSGTVFGRSMNLRCESCGVEDFL